MEFTFSEDQQALRGAVADLLARETAGGYVRQMAEQADGAGITDELWQTLADLGWLGLLVPEAHGGLGLGLTDLVVVLEEMGRIPFPGPYLSSAVLATSAAVRLGLDDRLGALASGVTRGTVAIDELGHGDPIDRIRTRASRKSGRWRLTGEKAVVLDGHRADWVLVPARTQEGLTTFLVDTPKAQVVPTLDVTRSVSRLVLEDLPAERIGPDGDHTSVWRRVADDGAIAVCAELVGGMERAHALAVQYAIDRVQFDRPIATFQVIKHKAVDMLHRLELSRVGTHYAAWASETDDPVREEATAMAKAYVPESAIFLTGEAIQIFGGVGFTWDCDAHLHYRRAKQGDLLLGYQGWQRERLADLVLATS